MTDTPAAPTAPRELRGRIGSCVEHGSAAEFYDDNSGQCLYCCQVETSCNCAEARSTPAEALDVERLEAVLDEPGIYELWKFTEWGNDDLKGSVKAFARILTAEYKRLRSPESDEK